MMQLSKIGSKNTYHKCLKELHVNGYIIYPRSHSKFHPVISMFRWDINEEESKFRQLELFASDSAENLDLLRMEKVPEGRNGPQENLGEVPSIISGTECK